MCVLQFSQQASHLEIAIPITDKEKKALALHYLKIMQRQGDGIKTDVWLTSRPIIISCIKRKGNHPEEREMMHSSSADTQIVKALRVLILETRVG